MNPNLTPGQRAVYGIYPGMALGLWLAIAYGTSNGSYILLFLAPIVACMLFMGSPLMENKIVATIVTLAVVGAMMIYIGWAAVVVVGLVGGAVACSK